MSFLRRLPPLFFIGLFPVVCLLWLWADSMHAKISWGFGGERNHMRSVTVHAAEIRFRHTVATEVLPEYVAQYPRGAFSNLGPYGNFSRSSIGVSTRDWFPKPAAGVEGPYSHPVEDHSYISDLVVLPIWLVLLGYLPLWLTLAWWQARRRRRKHEAALPVADGACGADGLLENAGSR